MKDLKLVIAKNIAALRQNKGMTQAELASKINYSDKAISKWERGESVPDVMVLYEIATMFGVTLDWLTEEEHKQNIESEPESITNCLSPQAVSKKIKNKVTNRIIITSISSLLVWFVATIVFVCIDIFTSATRIHYIAFAYAVPASSIVWLVFNSIWFNVRRNYYIVSIMMWSLIASIYLTLFLLGFNLWQLFLLGIPGQIIIVLWSLLSFKSQKNKSSEK